MSIKRNLGIEILLCFRWQVASGELSPAAITKLGPYITRYAATLNILVHAVGGIADHLHILADVPPDLAVDRVSKELQGPTARYIKDVLSSRGFAWDTDNVAIVSVAPAERETLVAYFENQEIHHAQGDLDPLLEAIDSPVEADATTPDEELPNWLTRALS